MRLMLDMEGFLLKWTNYLSGWQPRYFVLDSGILSYYDSQDDVGKGSKGSIKMAVCEIRVHSSDGSRMDLIIPGEQCFYLRADNAVERQRWLVALGSSKACLGDSASQKTKDSASDTKSLGRKLSELRLFCDLLMQQVGEVQESMDPDESGVALDVKKLRAACSLLNGICSQIYCTLEDCMKHVNTNVHQAPPLPTLPADIVGTKLPQTRKGKCSISQSVIQTPQRSIRESPKQADGVTVLRNLEQIAMRSQTWEPQLHLPATKFSVSNQTADYNGTR